MDIRNAIRVGWKPAATIGTLAVLVTCALLLTTSYLPSLGSKSSSRQKGKPGPKIHVCLCSDDTDLRPAAVAIRSAHMSSANPERLVFHFITTPEHAPLFRELFRLHLEGIRVEVHHDAKLQQHIQKFISFRESSKARKILASPFNFAPFYLHDYLEKSRGGGTRVHAKRLIYLDTDTLILGDLTELYDMDLQGHACAAVKYCLQHWEDYINFDTLKELGYHNFDPKSCIANRGAVVIDVPRWKQSNITGKIEQWLVHYKNARNDLWVGGMSQPPWLLAINGDYLELSDKWNCNSLGRDSMSLPESQTLRKSGFDHKALRRLEVNYSEYGHILPYVVTCSAGGKLLHYNGAMKPWLMDDGLDKKGPVCARPQSIVDHSDTSSVWSRTVRIFCEETTFVNCAELWHLYITESASCALKDLDKEWQDDERKWTVKKLEDEASMIRANEIVEASVTAN